ncbi:MAG: hypothetical protein PHD76_10575 [Methylacidiphilales bacterium]|nr:hypothetical protein [Candidatus Methylacidiphilales bacterium]
MKQIAFITLILFGCWAQAVPMASPSDTETDSESACRHKTSVLVDKINQFYLENGFKSSLIQVSKWKLELTDAPHDYHQGAIRLNGYKDPNPSQVATFNFLQTSFKFIQFFNDNYHANAPFYDAPERIPKWPKEKAEQLASEFAKIFLQDWNLADFKFEKVVWESNSGGGGPIGKPMKYSEGYWIAILRRTTPSGVPFDDDSIMVDISETYGPYILSLFYLTHYEEKPYQKIGEDKGLQLANEKLPEILKLQGLVSDTKTISVLEKPRIREVIVRPNYWPKTSKRPVTLEERSEGRPAYIVTYHVLTAVGNKPVVVYIDSETGDFLGGNY